MKIKSVKGSEDFYPIEYIKKEYIIKKFEEICKMYDYDIIQTPVFESLDFLCAKGGEEVKGQIFLLEKKGNEELGLRFDMTIPCARLFLQKQLELSKPVRWAYACENFRYERPQAGRLRSFTQLGCETYGSDNILSDVEQLNIVIDVLTSLGLTFEDISIRVNDRNLLEGMILDISGKDKIQQIISAFDKFNKIGDDNFYSILINDLNIDKEEANKLLEIVKIRGGKEILKNYEKFLKNEIAKKGFENLKQISELCDMRFIEFDSSIARGLDYYTGFVFECFDKYGYFRAICGGGRYNNMIEQFGGQKTPAVGFAIGITTLSLLLEKLKKIPVLNKKIDYYISCIGEDIKIKEYVLKIANKLRKKNKVCNLEIVSKSINKKFTYAENINSENIIIIGEKELEEKTISIKNLKTGKQELLKYDEL